MNKVGPGSNNDSDSLAFSDDPGKRKSDSPNKKGAWRIIISDDNEDIHALTRMVLKNYSFQDRNLSFLSAYSGRETKILVKENPDAAIILLDVVMETDEAGLEVAKFIREELDNKFIRIILRTGQAGKAPENKIILEYDINDYKEKTELTAQKLFTTITSALRSYNDIRTIEKSKIGLEKIINSSRYLFESHSLTKFAGDVLKQLVSLLEHAEDSIQVHRPGFIATFTEDDYKIIAATGEFERFIGKPARGAVSGATWGKISEYLSRNGSGFWDDDFVGTYAAKSGSKSVLYFNGCGYLSDLEKYLVRVYSTNVSIAFENLFLNKDIRDTQEELINILGGVIETRSEETINHARRVAEYTYLLARKLDMSEDEAQMLKIASPMHDIGKIGIPDSILLKPDKLSDREFEFIKKHTKIGYNLFCKSLNEVLKIASIITSEHHERWDGDGYPKGLKANEIHIYGQIGCITDVFDALCHRRVYKDPWNIDEVINYLKIERARHFSPKLVDTFLENIDEFIAIKNKYSD